MSELELLRTTVAMDGRLNPAIPGLRHEARLAAAADVVGPELGNVLVALEGAGAIVQLGLAQRDDLAEGDCLVEGDGVLDEVNGVYQERAHVLGHDDLPMGSDEAGMMRT